MTKSDPTAKDDKWRHWFSVDLQIIQHFGLIRIFMIIKCCTCLQCKNWYEHATPLNVIVFLCLSILDTTEV